MSRPPLLTALLHPVNLGMLALITIASLCSAWWLAPVGLIFWLVMVATIARDPGLQISFTRQQRDPLSPRYQTRFDRIDRARMSIYNAVGQASPAYQHAIQPVQTRLDDLVEMLYQMALRMSALDNHYSVQRLTNDFAGEIEDLRRKSNQTTDLPARREFEQTILSLQARQEQLTALSNILDRFEAQITGSMNAVDSVVTGVVTLKGRNPDQVREKVPAIMSILDQDTSEILAFEESIQQISIT